MDEGSESRRIGHEGSVLGQKKRGIFRLCVSGSLIIEPQACGEIPEPRHASIIGKDVLVAIDSPRFKRAGIPVRRGSRNVVRYLIHDADLIVIDPAEFLVESKSGVSR